MKIFGTILILCCFAPLLDGTDVFAQGTAKSRDKSASTLNKDKQTIGKEAEHGDYFPNHEIKSPFRYIVVNDDVQFNSEDAAKEPVPVRRFVTVLMEKRAFNKANLTYLFKNLSHFYADPLYLGIEVHTSLKTLETLEESSALSTHASRDRFRRFYRTATYTRFNDGSDGFLYDTGIPGQFVMKNVSLTKPGDPAIIRN